MTIRQAGPADFAQIIQIAQEINSKIENKAYFNWPSEVLLKELGAVQTLVIEVDGEIVSFLCYRDLIDVFEISALGTLPRAQGKGYQSEIIDYLQWLTAEQHQSIVLEVHHKNQKAQSLYQKKGFVMLNKRQHYYSDGGDALVLGWGVME